MDKDGLESTQQKNETAVTPEIDNFQPATDVSEVPDDQQTNSRKPSLLLISIASLVIVGIIGVGAYQFMINRGSVNLANDDGKETVSNTDLPMTITDAPTVTITPSLITSSDISDKANWQVYSDDMYPYSISFPEAWLVTHESHTFDSRIAVDEKIKMTKVTGDDVDIQIFYEGEFDHGFMPWEKESEEVIMLDEKQAKKVKMVLENNPNYWSIISLEDGSDFRIEAQYPKAQESLVTEILASYNFEE